MTRASGLRVEYAARRRPYALQCSNCGRLLEDDGYVLDCDADHAPSLLQTTYAAADFSPDTSLNGVFRYRSWLPVTQVLPESYGPVCYRSTALGEVLGLENVWIAFNGYWPERGARLPTGSFKDLEALVALARLPLGDRRVLVVPSSGNTAAAFSSACSVYERSCLVVIPERGFRHLSRQAIGRCVKIVVLAGATYDDAIAFAARVSARPGFLAEGGIRNVARRDGVATTLFAAYEAMGKLPDYYFQAIGSGAGAIAITEAARRLQRVSERNSALPRLFLSQNAPFSSLVDAWNTRTRAPVVVDPATYRAWNEEMLADTLANRRPAYSVYGGLFDVLQESGGDVVAVSNQEARHACDLFRATEGVDIGAESGVALGSLLAASARQGIPRDATILLHVTGAGKALLDSDSRIQANPVALRLEPGERDSVLGLDAVDRLFS